MSHLLGCSQSGDSRGTRLPMLAKEEAVDVGEHASVGDGCLSDELVQLVVILDGQLQVARCNCLLLLLLGCVARKLADLTSEILKDGCSEDSSTDTNLRTVATTLVHRVDACYGEDDACLGTLRLRGGSVFLGGLADRVLDRGLALFAWHANLNCACISVEFFSIINDSL